MKQLYFRIFVKVDRKVAIKKMENRSLKKDTGYTKKSSNDLINNITRVLHPDIIKGNCQIFPGLLIRIFTKTRF